jgi:hypothetical protein
VDLGRFTAVAGPTATWRRIATGAAAAVAAALLSAPAAGAQPPTLTGESIVSTGVSFPFPPGGTPGDVNVTGTCDPSGTSTFQFTATGAAAGPYPGTFTESGSFSMAAPPVPGGIRELVAFNASFTIDSPNGHVTGTKSFTAAAPGATTLCSQTPYRVLSGLAPSHYDARIETPTETVTTSGDASSTLFFEQGPPKAADYSESFLTGTPVVPVPPPQPQKPGKGCGDKNHVHEREGECKKPPR